METAMKRLRSRHGPSEALNRLGWTFIGLPLVLTACGGYGGAPAIGPIPCLFNGQSQLIYPIPNATNVPDTPQQIVFATSRLFPSTFDVLVNGDPNPNVAVNGKSAFFQQIQPSQVPQPSATPAITNAFFESAPVAASFPHGTYYVFLNDTLGGCTPTSAGSFTTQ
jgi:hypothetical protein